VFGVSRQSYYQRDESYYERACFREFVVEYVRKVRKDFPKMGSLKLYEKSKNYFGVGLQMGRDSFIELLREQGLLLKLKRRRRTKTTDSVHSFKKYGNLVKDYVPASACRLWVSDITYLPMQAGFSYLSLITDAYSRKIVGWAVADTLKYIHTENALCRALKEAVKEGFDTDGMIHHSDRGVQYAYPDYTALLLSYGCKISMTQTSDPRDNAIAERVNGILKTEWLDGYEFGSLKEVKRVVARVIELYNNERPHMGIGMKVPSLVHRSSLPLRV
jgi:transposase InsO family protein